MQISRKNIREIKKGAYFVRSELKFGVNSSDNLAKYEEFSFQPIGALELRSMTSELRIMFRE